MKSVRLGLISTIAVAATLLAGCSDDEGSAAPAPAPVGESSSAAPSSEASASASEDAEPADTAPAGETATPGTEYKLGEKAVIAYKSGNNQGTIGISVNAIEKGTPEDLAPLDLGEKAKGQAPYFIRVTVTNEGGEDMAFTSSPRISGELPDGSMAGKVSIIGDFDKCPHDSAPKDFTSKGASYETCVLAVAPEASSVESARFSDEAYQDESLVWKA